ncbi:MAG: hypothetical protein ACOCUA_02060 [archaeon]
MTDANTSDAAGQRSSPAEQTPGESLSTEEVGTVAREVIDNVETVIVGNYPVIEHVVTALLVLAAFDGFDVRPFRGEFQPIQRNTCASCHTPDRAGDSCLDCHNYHTAHEVP